MTSGHTRVDWFGACAVSPTPPGRRLCRSVARSRDLSLFEGFLERKGTKGFLEKVRDFFEKCKNLIFYGL